jgi:hypothetical protein
MTLMRLPQPPEQAYEKYSENNVEWEFASTTAYDLVLREYEALLDNDKKVFEAWLKDEPKAAALHKEVHHSALTKVGNSYEMAQLKELTDSSVLYRLPPGFPVIDYCNPPNNCLSVNVGKKHLIDLEHVEQLCKVVPLNKQVNFVHVSPSRAYMAMKYCQSFELPQNITLLDGTKPEHSVLHKLPAQTIQGLSHIVQFCMRFKSW